MRITILSDSPFIPTGYRNQAVMLAKFLKKKGHEIHYLANAFNGITIDYAKLFDGTELDFKIYGEMVHSYFQGTMSQHLKETNSDRFFILLDTFMLFPWFLNIDTSPAKTLFWFPSDGGGGMPKGCEQMLRKIDKPIAMSRFGQKQIKDYYGIDLMHIPHGTEPDKFYRLPDEEKNKLREKWGFKDKFVIGVVARNQPRKNLDRTIKIMAMLKDKIPNAILFLHMDPNDPAGQMFHMPSLIQKFNIENRVVFSGMQAHKGFEWNRMNEVYNLMDVFLLSTSGEGFGIPIIEAMSCEVPVLATDYTTTQELVKDNKAGIGIKLSGTEEIDMFNTDSKKYDEKVLDGTITGSWEVERGFCSITDAVEKLKFLHDNPEIRREMGRNGRKAVLEKYDFDKIVGPALEAAITS
jgi:glycosyltransferase involved in cell wall biosynthesis